MSVNDFIEHPKVLQLIQKLKQNYGDKEYSDIVDDANNQYIDLVMEGGGVLGIALIGYTYVLEEMGIRFLGIGGTSAGSINALLLASLAPPAERKSEKIVEIIAGMPLREFLYGDDDVQDFVDAYLENAGKIKLSFKGMQVIDNLWRDYGLNPGDYFLEYVAGVLKEAKIETTRALTQRLTTLPQGLKIRGGKELSVDEAAARLAIVAADISTETKVEFPKMASLYWKNPDDINPATFVRASMSIPGVFHPFRVENIPDDEAASNNWLNIARYDGTTPSTAIFVDGGIMSNFPINLFHQPDKVPIAPTFGAKLGTNKRKPHEINNVLKFGQALFDSARHTLDYDFINENPDYKKLIAYIDTGPHYWLNFEMNIEDRIDLFVRGAEAAADFLATFNWEEYKEIRRHLARIN